MDSVDAVILWDLGFDYQAPLSTTNRRPNLRRIADGLGIDRKTVSSRVRKMEEGGFIGYYQTYPNIAAAGMKASSYLLPFKEPAAKREAVNKLKLVKEILRIDECLNSLRFTVVYDKQPDLDRTLRLILTLTASEPLRLYDFQLPRVRRELGETDWRIMKSLRYDALKPSRKIAEELGISSRAVNYHLERLIKERALLVAPVFDMKHVAGTILYGLIFQIDEDDGKRPRAIEKITDTFKQNSFCRVVGHSGTVMFMMFTDRIAEPEENYLNAKAMEGVTNVHMDFIRRTHDCSEQIDACLEEQIVRKRRKVPEIEA